MFDLLIKWRHIWLGQKLKLEINSRLLLKNYQQIFQRIAINSRKFFLDLNLMETNFADMDFNIIIEFLERNFGSRLYLKTLMDSDQMHLFKLNILNGLKEVNIFLE